MSAKSRKKPQPIRKETNDDAQRSDRLPFPLSPENDCEPCQKSGSNIASAPRQGAEKPLEEDDFEILRTMVREFKANRIDFAVLPRRPRFKKPRINSGISCSGEIRARALKMIRMDPDSTGGSLSSLIELLLWKYLGCPEDVVERFPQ